MQYKFDGNGISKMTPDCGIDSYFHSKQHFIGRCAQIEAQWKGLAVIWSYII